jgi:hypothetical protein
LEESKEEALWIDLPGMHLIFRPGRRGGGHLAPSIAALILAGSVAFAQAPKTVAISGSVLDDSGAPIAGGTVFYKNTPAIFRDRLGRVRGAGQTVASSTLTAKDGTFSVAGLPPSVYLLCAQGVLQTHLRSCDWQSPPTQIDLTSSSSAANVKLQVPVGVILTFQVTDAGGKVNDFASAPPTGGGKLSAPGNFRIFVTRGTWMAVAQPVSVSGAVRRYALAVPRTASLQFLLDSKLNVLDQLQSPIVPGRPTGTIAISGQPVTYALTVQ